MPQVIRRMLNSLGFECDIVSNGLEAVHSITDGDYSLLLLDLHMPVMGGLEAASAIR